MCCRGGSSRLQSKPCSPLCCEACASVEGVSLSFTPRESQRCDTSIVGVPEGIRRLSFVPCANRQCDTLVAKVSARASRDRERLSPAPCESLRDDMSDTDSRISHGVDKSKDERGGLWDPCGPTSGGSAEDFQRGRQAAMRHGMIVMLVSRVGFTPVVTNTDWGQIVAYCAFCVLLQDRSAVTVTADDDLHSRLRSSAPNTCLFAIVPALIVCLPQSWDDWNQLKSHGYLWRFASTDLAVLSAAPKGKLSVGNVDVDSAAHSAALKGKLAVENVDHILPTSMDSVGEIDRRISTRGRSDGLRG